MKQFYTAESVTEGHSDKLCDLIADSVLDDCLRYGMTGEKVLILEENGRFYIENAVNMAFQRVEEGFHGAAAETGFRSEEEMQDYVWEIREERRGDNR